MALPFNVGEIFTRVQTAMSGRNLVQQDTYNKIADTVTELSETYKFPGLQRPGPPFTLTQFVPGPYPYQDFFTPEDLADNPTIPITNIDSFWMYYQQPQALSSTNQTNSGLQIIFKTFDAIEQAINITGIVINWTRYNDQIYFAFAPSQAYVVYARYRIEHPFSDPPAASDPIFLPNNWQDIVTYASSERTALDLNLTDRVTRFHNILYGDPKFQATGGIEGAPGLIFMRTSQEQRDQVRTTRGMRLKMQRATVYRS